MNAFILQRAVAQPADAPDLEEFHIPLWYESVEVRGGLGYKDNVLLSHADAQGSGFWLSGVEALVFRLPTRGWQCNFLLDATDTRYFNAPEVDDEQFVLAGAEVNKDFGQGWQSALGFNYVFQNQVFDMSTTYTNETAIGQVLGHALMPRWRVRRTLTACWLEAEFTATRQYLDSPLDSFWLLGPKATIGRSWTNGSEIALSYQWSHLSYDEREQVDSSGATVTNSSLALQAHSVELAWTQAWDARRRWQTIIRAGFEKTMDNGSGYFDYDCFRLAQELRFRTEHWEVKAHARAGHYNYETQTVSATDATHRRKTVVSLGLRAEHQLTKHFKANAGVSWERSLSNLQFDDYQAGTVTAGLAAMF